MVREWWKKKIADEKIRQRIKNKTEKETLFETRMKNKTLEEFEKCKEQQNITEKKCVDADKNI